MHQGVVVLRPPSLRLQAAVREHLSKDSHLMLSRRQWLAHKAIHSVPCPSQEQLSGQQQPHRWPPPPAVHLVALNRVCKVVLEPKLQLRRERLDRCHNRLRQVVLEEGIHLGLQRVVVLWVVSVLHRLHQALACKMPPRRVVLELLPISLACQEVYLAVGSHLHPVPHQQLAVALEHLRAEVASPWENLNPVEK